MFREGVRGRTRSLQDFPVSLPRKQFHAEERRTRREQTRLVSTILSSAPSASPRDSLSSNRAYTPGEQLLHHPPLERAGFGLPATGVTPEFLADMNAP